MKALILVEGLCLSDQKQITIIRNELSKTLSMIIQRIRNMARYKETLAGNPTRLNKSKRGEIGVKLEHVLSVKRALLVKGISLKLKDSFLHSCQPREFKMREIF